MDLRRHQQILRDALTPFYEKARAERAVSSETADLPFPKKAADEENASASLAEASEGPEAGQLHLWP